MNAFNNTTIQNNFIRIPTDLNATVAPADVSQNIGIHFSFGTNQQILGNTIQFGSTMKRHVEEDQARRRRAALHRIYDHEPRGHACTTPRCGRPARGRYCYWCGKRRGLW